ncbi:ABC transporter substrate-binding protein, partial [Streptomyces sp. NPDC057705]
MNANLGRAAVGLAVSALTVTLAACGGAEEGDSGSDGAVKVGLLLPENETARYEKFDKPLMEKKVALLTLGKGKVVYDNAMGDAAKQNAPTATTAANTVASLPLKMMAYKT